MWHFSITKGFRPFSLSCEQVHPVCLNSSGDETRTWLQSLGVAYSCRNSVDHSAALWRGINSFLKLCVPRSTAASKSETSTNLISIKRVNSIMMKWCMFLFHSRCFDLTTDGTNTINYSNGIYYIVHCTVFTVLSEYTKSVCRQGWKQTASIHAFSIWAEHSELNISSSYFRVVLQILVTSCTMQITVVNHFIAQWRLWSVVATVLWSSETR